MVRTLFTVFVLRTLKSMNAHEVVALAQVRQQARSGVARRIRLDAALSLSEIAAAVGCSHVTVYRWEIGEAQPTGNPALRYHALLADLRNIPRSTRREKARP